MFQDKANCLEADTKLFFSELRSKVDKAKALCNACVVKDECLQFALDLNIEYGTYGGLTETERKELVKNGSL